MPILTLLTPGGGRKGHGLQFDLNCRHRGLGETQNYFVNSYLVVGRVLNPFLERLSHSIGRRMLKKADRSRFYQFDF